MSDLNRTFDFVLDEENKKILLKRKIGATWTSADVTEELIQLISKFLFLSAEEDAEEIAVKFTRITTHE